MDGNNLQKQVSLIQKVKGLVKSAIGYGGEEGKGGCAKIRCKTNVKSQGGEGLNERRE